MSAKSKTVAKKSANVTKKGPATPAARSAKEAAKKPAKVETAKSVGRKTAVNGKSVAKPAPAPVSAARAGVKSAVAAAKPASSGKASAPKTAPKPAAKAPAPAAPAKLARPAPAPVSPVPAAKPTGEPFAPAVGKAIRPGQPGVGFAGPVGAKPVPPVAAKVAPPAPAEDANKKKAHQRHGFRTNEYVVYPSHGVGKIVAIEQQTIAGMSLELFVINFEQEKMTLRVPTAKLEAVRMRKLAEGDVVRRAMETLKGRARIKRTMWSRRAQEYESKINSGDLVQISEVVRDLYRAESQPEQSYSERQLFEAALDRMSREIAAIEKLDDRGAVQKIVEILAKSARGRRPVEDGTIVPPSAEEQAA